MKGIVIASPVYDREKKQLRRCEDGKIRFYPHIRTLDGRRFRLYQDEIQTPGLVAIKFGQVVQFVADGRVAREVHRYASYTTPRWLGAAQAIEKSNGASGWLKGTIVVLDDEALAIETLDGRQFDVDDQTFIIRRDPEDMTDIAEGDEVYVKPDGDMADEVLFLEKHDREIFVDESPREERRDGHRYTEHRSRRRTVYSPSESVSKAS